MKLNSDLIGRKRDSSGGWILLLIVFLCFLAMSAFITFLVLASQIEVALDKISYYRQQKNDINNEIARITPQLSMLRIFADKGDNIEEYEPLKSFIKEVSKRNGFNDEFITLEEQINYLYNELYHINLVLDQRTNQLGMAQNSLEASKDKLEKISKVKKQTRSAISKRVNKVGNDLDQIDTRYLELEEQLKDKKKLLEAQIEEERKKVVEEKRRLEFKLKKAKEQVKSFSRRKVNPSSIYLINGQLYNPDSKNEYAYINLGEGDNIKPGTKFMAFEKGRAGKEIWRGIVEVKKITGKHSTLVSIIKIFDEFKPVLDGHLITNPFYSPARPKVITLKGEFSKLYYGMEKEEIIKRIQSIGARIDESVSVETSFIITGKNAPKEDADMNFAKKLGIPVIPYTELQLFLED